MFLLFGIAVIRVVAGHYCDIPECPEFSLMKSLHVKEANADFIELVWEPRDNYTVENYEVHWYAESGCQHCEGQMSLLNTSVKITVKPCTMYTFEVYGFDENLQKRAPAILSKVSAPSFLTDGSVVRVGNTWAFVRWLQPSICTDSTHIAVCYGPNIAFQLKLFNPDNVVVFKFSSLSQDSDYVCIAYTLNSAGSSWPSQPVSLTTNKDVLIEDTNIRENILAVAAILLLLISSIISIMFLQSRKGFFQLHWRRSYTVNETRV